MLTLDPHQIVGADFMSANDSALVFDEAGLGKSAQTVAACDKARLRRILITCPTVVKEHWRREFQRFSVYNRSVEIIEGFPKHVSTADIVITSHAAVTRAEHVAAYPGPWEAIVIDEAHMARNWGSKLSQSLFGMEPYSLWRHTSAVWPLSGTPVVNSAFDLYPFIASSLSRRLPRQFTGWEFMNEFTYVRKNFRGEMVPTGVVNEDQLWDLLKPFVLRRKGILDIPLKMNTFPVKVDDQALKPVMAELAGLDPEKIEQAIIDEIDVEGGAISRVRHAMGLAKAKSASQYLQYLFFCCNSGPIVAFFIHTEVRKRVMEDLEKAGLRVAFADGKSREDVQAICDRYQAGQIDIFLIQYVTGGTGLTLTLGNRVVAIEMPWTAIALEQATNRVRRKTQNQMVIADILFAEGCWLEAVQAKVIDQKMRTAIKILRC